MLRLVPGFSDLDAGIMLHQFLLKRVCGGTSNVRMESLTSLPEFKVRISCQVLIAANADVNARTRCAFMSEI